MSALLTVAESAHEVRRNLEALACMFGVIAFAGVPPADGQPPVHDPLVEMQPDPTRAPATWCGGER